MSDTNGLFWDECYWINTILSEHKKIRWHKPIAIRRAVVVAATYTRIIYNTLQIANQLDPSLNAALEGLDEFHKRAQSAENEAATPTEDVTAVLD